jgi:DNA polymerase III delta prime subunit
MSTNEETRSMNDCPLPLEPVTLAIVNYETNCPADRVLTSILMIDEQMASIEATVTPYLRNLTEQREKLLARAIQNNIMEDSQALLIEVQGKLMRNEISDLEAFSVAFPGKLEVIRRQQEADLTDKYTKNLEEIAESKVPLTLADKKIGKEKITEFVGYKPQTISYEIRRR